MLRFQMTLIILLIACVMLSSCDELVEILTPPKGDTPNDMMPEDGMTMGLPQNIAMYSLWATSVDLPAPGPVAEAGSAAETGAVHGMGTRTVYINDIGARALQDESLTAYPVGTTIVKALMDDANTFVQKVATMMKTDDPMYASHNGWIYKKYARPDTNTDYTQVKGDGLPDAAEGCHGCHAQADRDSVFVDFLMPDTMGDGGTGESQ